MTGVFSADLQAAVYQRLAADVALAGLIDGAIFDAPPDGPRGADAPDHLLIGEERIRPNDSMTSRGALHDFSVTVHSARDGFERAKRIAAAVCESLVDAELDLVGGRVVALRFLRATAERGRAPDKRRIALRFRAVVDQND
jgi:hypothetical protein